MLGVTVFLYYIYLLKTNTIMTKRELKRMQEIMDIMNEAQEGYFGEARRVPTGEKANELIDKGDWSGLYELGTPIELEPKQTKL